MRINQDGTCGVPGLTETAVLNVDDVLQCIGAPRNSAGRFQMILAGGFSFVGACHVGTAGQRESSVVQGRGLNLLLVSLAFQVKVRK